MKTKAELIEFNLNSHVQVRLTKRGKECMKENYDALASQCGGKLSFNFSLPKEDREGWSRWQLWILMNEFGHKIKMGAEVPFETTIKMEIERA